MIKYFLLIYLLSIFSLFADIIQKLEVIGNKRISVETIKVYGEIEFEKDYSDLDINKILKNLYETNFFEDIKISLNNGVLKIDLKEYPSLNSVSIVGEKSTTISKKVLERLQLQEKTSFIKNLLVEDIDEIKKIYTSMGFNFVDVEAKIEKFSDNRVNLIYFLKKGDKTRISKINFIGDKKIKDKRLTDIIASEEHKFWKFLSRNTSLSKTNVDLDKRLLVNYYKSVGYYDVQVLSSNAEINKNITTLTYTINAGSRYRITKISTNVSDVLDKNIFLPLQKKFTKVIGKYYSPFTVKNLLDDLDSLILNNDLQFIEHNVNEILEAGTIELQINIFEGKKLLVEKINIKGNVVTDEDVIRSELLLDEGDPFNSLKLDQSISRIKARNLFGEVKETVTNGSSKDLKIIDILVEEKPTGEISAGAGIGTDGASLALSISENNWLGRGINIGTNVDISKETFTGGFTVTNPNHNFSGSSLTYFANNTSNDKSGSGYSNNVTKTGIGTSFEQYKDIYLSPYLTFAYDELKVESTASESLKKQKGTFSDLSFEYSVRQDKRNRAFAPTDGYVSGFTQAFPLYADTPYITNSYKFSKYKAFSENYIGAFKFLGSAINGLSGKDVRISKRLGLSKLRGFEQGKIGPKDGTDYVGGNYAMSANFEIAMPNILPESSKTDIGVFLDVGNLWEADYDSALDDSNKIRSTIGVATSWNSPLGPMTFILSQNLTKASTDVTETFKFKLGTTF